MPKQYLPFLRRSKFKLELSSHWLFTPSHYEECLVRVTRTCMIHVRFYVRFCDTRKVRMVSYELHVRVSHTCITTFSCDCVASVTDSSVPMACTLASRPVSHPADEPSVNNSQHSSVNNSGLVIDNITV